MSKGSLRRHSSNHKNIKNSNRRKCVKRAEVSRATVGRVPIYLNYLKNTFLDTDNISATTLAKRLGLGEVQVRKDLSALSGAGRPKLGYNIQELITALETFIASDKNQCIILVGAGKLGRALLDYGGFGEYGLEIVAAFDIAVEKTERSPSGKPIYPIQYLDDFCREHTVRIGVVTVPAESAQTVCDSLVRNGVLGIWNFAPCHLCAPPGVLVQNEDMGVSLAYLNHRI